jgi:hypothetical protein
MLEPSAAGSHVVAIHHQTLSWAVHEVCRRLSVEDVHKLKVRSGEHIGTMLTTAHRSVLTARANWIWCST